MTTRASSLLPVGLLLFLSPFLYAAPPPLTPGTQTIRFAEPALQSGAEEVKLRLHSIEDPGPLDIAREQFQIIVPKTYQPADPWGLFIWISASDTPRIPAEQQEGLAAHIEAVCGATKLGVIVYNRDNAIVNERTLAKLCDKCPNLVGYKDGIGDIELMTRVYTKLGDRLTYIGGLPTAETFALPYLDMGVTTYSSAVFNFVPEFATNFYAAVRRRDHQTIHAGLNDFILPLIAIRNRKKGYAVSIIKAGMKVIGRDSGPVRPPLTDLTEQEVAEVAALVAKLPQAAKQQAAE